MALRDSEIDRLLDNDAQALSSDDGDDFLNSGSECEDNILSYSGSDDYQPSSDELLSDDVYESSWGQKKKRKRRSQTYENSCVGLKENISQLLESLEAEQPPSSISSQQAGSSSFQQPSTSGSPQPHPPTVNLEDTPQQVEQPGTSTFDFQNNRETLQTISVVKGKNGYAWTKQPKPNSRSRSHNIVHVTRKAKGTAAATENSLEAFLVLFDEYIVNKIVQHTNEDIQLKQTQYKDISSSVYFTNATEIKALIGILLFSAVHKDNHLNVSEMFNTHLSGNMYKAAFSSKRFRFLLDSLRFDDKATRLERRNTDKLAPIREIWSAFIKNCIDNYEPGPYLTLDEQLLAFRGRCPFKMYLPKKPAKYGIKIVMLCDVSTKYMLNAEPYLGKNSTPRNEPASHYYLKSLTQPYYGSRRNVTIDQWFNSVPLVNEVKQPPYNLTIIGTIRKDKPHLPQCMINHKNRDLGDVRYLYDGRTTLVSQKVKKNKVVCLLSSMHDSGTTLPSGKPVIIQHYNETKGGVDALDQMCSTTSCSRKTKRWPLCLFFGMINIAGVNSWVIRNEIRRKKKEAPISRKKFLSELYMQLLTPWLEQRRNIPTIQRSVSTMISHVLHLPKEDPPVVLPPENNRTTCKMCHYKKRRMTTNYCQQCRQAICAEHRAMVCVACAEEG